MAYRLIDGSIFLHIPRTGGTYVTQALKESGLIKEQIGHKHSIVKNDNSRKFVFLRYPYELAKSIYQYNRDKDWPEWWENHPWHVIAEPPKEVKTSFRCFLQWLIAFHPGFISIMYEKYLSGVKTKVFHKENIDRDISRMIFLLTGEYKHVYVCDDFCNASRETTEKIPEPLKMNFLETEKKAFEYWREK